MGIDKHLVEAELQRGDVKTAITANEHIAQSELFHTLQRTIQVLEAQNLKGTLNYILDNELWNSYGIFGADRKNKRHSASSLTYAKGSVVSINFGTQNIGSELSYSHMGVVIEDLDDYVVVVPVTTNRGQSYTTEVAKTILHVNGVFRKPSTLLVHQMKSVHKNRIKADIGLSIAGTPTWEELEKRIATKYASGVVAYYKLVIVREKRKLKNNIKDLKKRHTAEVAVKDKEIEDLRTNHATEIAAKDAEIAKLTQELVRVSKENAQKAAAAGDQMNLE